MYPLTQVRQFVISDPSTIIYHEYIKHNTGIPTVVWQQQMETAIVHTYNITYKADKPLPEYDRDYTKNFEPDFRPLPTIEDYDPYYVDPDYGRDPYWDEDLYDQHKLDFICNLSCHTDNNETDEPIVTEGLIPNALIHLWEPHPNSHIKHQSEEEQNNQQEPENKSLIDETIFMNAIISKEGEPPYVPLSTNLGLNTSAECSTSQWISVN